MAYNYKFSMFSVFRILENSILIIMVNVYLYFVEVFFIIIVIAFLR